MDAAQLQVSDTNTHAHTRTTCLSNLSPVGEKKHTVRFGLFFSLSPSYIEFSSLCSPQSVCFILDHSFCVGMRSESGALQRGVWSMLWTAGVGVLVKRRAVGGGCRSAVDSAAGAAAGWCWWGVVYSVCTSESDMHVNVGMRWLWETVCIPSSIQFRKSLHSLLPHQSDLFPAIHHPQTKNMAAKLVRGGRIASSLLNHFGF